LLPTPRLPCPTRFPYTTLFRSVGLGLLRHLRERLVVEHTVDLVDGRAALGREVLPRTGERIEVGGHGQSPVDDGRGRIVRSQERSEEHTSELQSRFDLVCRLLL